MDAAVPPHSAPPGIEGVMGYIGGPRATRVWTYADWLRFSHLRQFPIYAPDLSADPVTQADQAVSEAKKLRWAAFMPQPERRVSDSLTPNPRIPNPARPPPPPPPRGAA